jgi:hypothetical protein
MTALVSFADLCARTVLSLVALFWLRRRPPLAWLASLSRPAAFALACLPSAGRHLALAAAMLPRGVRREARVAYLLARALDAFEDLAPDCSAARAGLASACSYLRGQGEPPDATLLRAERDSDRVEQLLALRLNLLRAELNALPTERRERLLTLLEGMAQTMMCARTDRHIAGSFRFERGYADGVLGSAVSYAVEFVAPGPLGFREGCRATARTLQIANDLRDLEFDRSQAEEERAPHAAASLMIDALGELPLVSRLLRTIPFPARSGFRAATTLLFLTTAAFLLKVCAREFAVESAPSSFRLRHPVLFALLAGLNRSSFERSLASAEKLLGLVLLRSLGGSGDPADEECAGVTLFEEVWAPLTAFETYLAQTHPLPHLADSLLAISALVGRARQLVAALPDEPLEQQQQPKERALRLISADYLCACAFERAATLGEHELVEFSNMLARAATQGAVKAHDRSNETALVAFLARSAGEARHFQGAILDHWIRDHESIAEALGARNATALRSLSRLARVPESPYAATFERSLAAARVLLAEAA